MRIGYICNQSTCVSGASNGIRMQALIWRDALVQRGHDVVLINTWDVYDWKSFDVVHAFSFGDSISFLHELKKRGIKTVCSPIIDSNSNKFFYKLGTFVGCNRLRLSSPGFNLRKQSKYVDLFLARSEYEAGYIRDCYDVPSSKVKVVPLSYRSESMNIDLSVKEDFCFHCSSITQGRKNVMRLILAAIKYKFKLVLAGSTGSESSFAPFKKLIEENDNIQCLGFVSEDQLKDLYRRAKVFALPSLLEGVGLVALEAAMHGCDIVLTNIGGPKEYFSSELAYLVDPYSVDEIGEAVCNALQNTKQPELMNYVRDKYALEKCIDNLLAFYSHL